MNAVYQRNTSKNTAAEIINLVLEREARKSRAFDFNPIKQGTGSYSS
jgi:hypothetical protein